MSVWPSNAKQQKICKRRDTTHCMTAGAPGCELCMPCRYTDEQITVRELPAAEVRARHQRDVEAFPLSCAGCFNARPREVRERQVTEHLVELYGNKEPHVIEGLRGGIGRVVKGFPDARLTEARDWSAYEWREWMDANLPPLLTDGG